MYNVSLYVCGITQYTYANIPSFAGACSIASRYALIACERGWDGLYTVRIGRTTS